MMTLARTASLLVVFSLLTSPTTADGAGTWILWSESWALGTNKESLPDTWAMVGRAESSGPCYQAAQARINKALATGAFRQAGTVLISDYPRNVDYRAFIHGLLDEATIQKWARQEQERGPLTLYISFICLPDTVDPREPK